MKTYNVVKNKHIGAGYTIMWAYSNLEQPEWNVFLAMEAEQDAKYIAKSLNVFEKLSSVLNIED